MTDKFLKLKAADAEDVQVISAILQDAIVPVCDIAWQPENKTFVMAVQRLRREGESEGYLERICSAVHVGGVETAQTQGIDLSKGEQMLDMLAVVLEGKILTFIGAGDAKIRLRLGAWFMALEDFGEPWPAKCNPCHDSGNAA